MTDRPKQARARDDAGQQHAGVDVDFLYPVEEAPQFDAPASPLVADGLWPPQIIVEKSGRIYFLAAQEVEYLASAGNYVVAHVGGQEFLTRATLKCMSARLAPLGFIQVERSLLVNLRRVAYVERLDRGQFCFVMRGGARLVSSRERSATLRAFFLGVTCP